MTTVGTAHAAEVWVGDFETGDLSQWNFVLNGDVGGNVYAWAQGELVAEGSFAGRLELHNDAVWPNGLKRVELQHRPQDARTAEGATTYFAWSFYLPQTLPADPGQTIGYWESANSYQQMMAFSVQGESISFYTRQPSNVEQWHADGVVTAEQWHRIAMGITWSKDEGVGRVDVWFDGEQVVDQGVARTLNDDNPHFTQVGLLRGAIEFEDVPVIIIDDAVEGDSVEDVRPDDLPSEGGDTGTGEGGSDSGTSGAGDASSGTTDGYPDPTGVIDDAGTALPGEGGDEWGDGSGSTGSGAGESEGSDSGCGCRSGSGTGGLAAWGLLGLLGLRRRRR